MLKVIDVRAVPGDAAFLIDNGARALLYDTGFAFTGARVAENVRRALGDRPLDFVFLTHSHYDHAAGTPYIKRVYPTATVVAGEYAARIFAKPTARALMRELDSKAAKGAGVLDYEVLIDALTVDRSVADGDRISVGEDLYEVLSLPGHTKCSVGFYCADRGLLLSSETLGVFNGVDDVVPSYLVGYGMTVASLSRVEKLAPRAMVLPHLGLIEGETVALYLRRARERNEEVAETVTSLLRAGRNSEEIAAWFEQTFYHGYIRDVYPIDAMRLNTSIMIDLLRRELIETEDNPPT